MSKPVSTATPTASTVNWALEDLIRDAVFVVEASSYEKQSLWERFATEAKDLVPRTNVARVRWVDQGRGWVVTVGHVGKRPVTICVFGSLLNGHPVLFYEAASAVVDWDKIREWFRANCWPLWDSGTRRAHCDAMNFHHCLEVVNGDRP